MLKKDSVGFYVLAILYLRLVSSFLILYPRILNIANSLSFQVQLTVTPRVEGILKIVGVRWKLSSSVVGFHNFESNFLKKNILKGRRKSDHSPINELKFMVIKVHASCTPCIHALMHVCVWN